MIVIGEEAAKEGIFDPLDFLSRDHELRTDFYIAIAKDKSANEILNVLTSLTKLPANKMFKALESSAENWAATGKVRLNLLIDDIVIDGKEPVIPGITIIGDPTAGESLDNVQTIKPKATLEFTGLAVFSQNRLIGWLSEEESKGYNYIQDNVESTITVIDCEEGQAGIELIHTESTIEPRIENGKPVISITIEGEGNLADANCKLDTLNPNTISDLEKKTNEQIERVVRAVIDKAQKEYKTDFLGFGERLFKDIPGEWRKRKDNWSAEFEQIDVEVTAMIKIRGVGTISNPFRNEIEEE
jgi:spore germination protein KC